MKNKDQLKLGSWIKVRTGLKGRVEDSIVARQATRRLQESLNSPKYRTRDGVVQRALARLATGYYDREEVADRIAAKLIRSGILNDILD